MSARKYINKTAIINMLLDGEMIECKVVDYSDVGGPYVTRYSIAGNRIHHSTISAMIRHNTIHDSNEDKSVCYALKSPALIKERKRREGTSQKQN